MSFLRSRKRDRSSIHFNPKASTTAALLFLMTRTTSAFCNMQVSSTLAISSKASSHHPNINRRQKLMVSRTEDPLPQDDPWVLLDEFKVWAIRNSGKYDMDNLQNSINTLRNECQFNIHTLEKEIATIQQTLQQREDDQSQSTVGDSAHSSQQHANDFHHDNGTDHMPTLKAVFAGFQVTEHDRERLASAHPPEDRP